MLIRKLLLSRKALIAFPLLLFSVSGLRAQGVGINTTGAAANTSAMLDIDVSSLATKRGMLIPRMTLAERTAMDPLPQPAQGLVVYQTDGSQGFYYNTSSTTTPSWLFISGSSSGDWSLTGNSGTSASTNFIGTTDNISFVIRTNNIERIRTTNAGNVGIGTNNPLDRLHVSDPTLPNIATLRVSGLASTTSLAPGATDVVVLADANGSFRRGLDGAKDAWYTTGNAATGVRSIGTTTNQAFQFICNNIVRGRVNPLDGEFVWGATGSPYTGDGLNSVATATTPFAINGYSAQNGAGVWGEILAANTTAFSAVQGLYSGSGSGSGVLGNYTGSSTLATRAGITGTINSPGSDGGIGVYGFNNTASGNQHVGVAGAYNGSAFGIGVQGIAFGGALMTGNNDVGVVGWRANNANYSGYYNGNHVIANGTKSASVGTSKGNQLLYCQESPELWFEDIGQGKLVNGQCRIEMDEIFREVTFVDADHPMHVFIQMEGESEDVYVIKDANGAGFTVKERHGGTSMAAFSYRVVAKRINFQDHRYGNDPVWGPGDTRAYGQYAPPPPVDYQENVRFQQEQRKNWRPTPLPAGFIDYLTLQKEAQEREVKKPESSRREE